MSSTADNLILQLRKPLGTQAAAVLIYQKLFDICATLDRGLFEPEKHVGANCR